MKKVKARFNNKIAKLSEKLESTTNNNTTTKLNARIAKLQEKLETKIKTIEAKIEKVQNST